MAANLDFETLNQDEEKEEESQEEDLTNSNFSFAFDLEAQINPTAEDIIKAQSKSENIKSVDELVRELKRKHDNDNLPPRKKRKLENTTKAPKKVVKPTKTWDELRLSKPIAKALRDLQFDSPTPIQAEVIPPALLNKDILASAQTGSGKTAAFMLPILERLLCRPKRELRTRVLVLCPTRELATQCFSMTGQMAKYMSLRSCLVVGGLSLKVQEASLRNKPDVVIATPGRMLDHLRNSMGVFLDYCEILILDEADKLLEMGFEDQLIEIINYLPKDRQSMLFSATLSNEVKELAKLSLVKPKRISVDPFLGLATNLSQEFVRIKAPQEKLREAMVLALCLHTFRDRVMVFCSTKAQAHRLKIIFALLNLNAVELHGNLTQLQRLQNLKTFTQGYADYLLCTDLVARGIDCPNVNTVINMHFPRDVKTYVHRVGRTARAGKAGHSVTLVSQTKKKVLKRLIKEAKTRNETVKSRVVDANFIQNCSSTIQKLHFQIRAVMKEEAEDRAFRVAEMEANRLGNLLEYEVQIKSQPKRTWFITEREKLALKKQSKEKLNHFDEDPENNTESENMMRPRTKEQVEARKEQRRRRKDFKAQVKEQKKREKELEKRERELDKVKMVVKGVKSQTKKKKRTMADVENYRPMKRKRRMRFDSDLPNNTKRLDVLSEKRAKKFEESGFKQHKQKKKRKSKHKNRGR